jgi:rhomboid protease GluP
MDFRGLITIAIFLSCCFNCLRTDSTVIWRSLSGAIALLLGAAWWSENIALQWMGWVIWLVLIGLPLLGFARVQQFVLRENYRSAQRLMTSVRWLHPWDGWREYPQLLRGLDLAQQGNLEAAHSLLQQHQATAGNSGKLAVVSLHRITARWQDYLIWFDRQVSPQDKMQASAVSLLYFRALGEVGNLEQLVQLGQRFLQPGGDGRDPFTRGLVRLYIFAFWGYPAAVQSLFSDVLRNTRPDMQQFWLATAQWQRGEDAIARETFRALQDRADISLQNAIAWRLAHPVPHRSSIPETLHPNPSQGIVQQMLWEMDQELRYRIRPTTQPRKAPITSIFMAINFIIFVLPLLITFALQGAIAVRPDWMPSESLLEFLGATFSYEWGVMIPREVLAGQVWRLLSAMFLHANIAHIFANLASLFILGGIVEPLLGRWRYFITYLGSGVGSMILVAAISIWQRELDQGVLGASGAIMGLLGALAAIYLHAWTQRGEQVAARQLRSVIAIAIIQTIFDSVTPQVSMSGHLTGLLCGFVIAILLLLSTKQAK